MKLFVIALILILIPCSIWAASEYPYTPFLMLGYIDTSVNLSVNIDDSVLPIDFSSDSVKFNSTPESHATGLKFGEYSIISNVNFKLYIAHTPFTLRTPTEAASESKDEEIDYVLYAFSDMATGTYSYCYSNANAANPASITDANGHIEISKTATNNLARIVDHALFLSLVDDAEKTISSSLRAGIYESTIYFVLETE